MSRTEIRELAFKLIYSLEIQSDKELQEQSKEAIREEKAMAKREKELEAMEEANNAEMPIDVPVIGDEDKETEE